MKSVHKITHKKIGRHKAVGLAYKETGEIVIDSRMKGFNHLCIAIHEILHLQNPRWAEAKVEGHSLELSNILWDMGYRKVDLADK
jgi:hypothetical protein